MPNFEIIHGDGKVFDGAPDDSLYAVVEQKPLGKTGVEFLANVNVDDKMLLQHGIATGYAMKIRSFDYPVKVVAARRVVKTPKPKVWPKPGEICEFAGRECEMLAVRDGCYLCFRRFYDFNQHEGLSNMKKLSTERLREIANLKNKTLSDGTTISPLAYSEVGSYEITRMARELLALRENTEVKKVKESDLQQIIDSHEKGTTTFLPVDTFYHIAKELQAYREVKPYGYFLEICGGLYEVTEQDRELPDVMKLYQLPPCE